MDAAADVIRYLLSFGGVITCYLIAAIWIGIARNSTKARRFLIVTALVFAGCSLYGPQYVIARAITPRVKPFSAADARRGVRTAIVVLGSGNLNVEDWNGDTYSFVDYAAAARVTEAARVFRMVDAAVVISSGGAPESARDERSTAESMRDALVILGVPADRIMTETASQNTRDEAVIVADMARAQKIEQMILVTSQSHMRRALGAFQAAGLKPIPAIALENRRHVSWTKLLLPSGDGLWVAASNVHEVLGLVYYRVRGWWARPESPVT